MKIWKELSQLFPAFIVIILVATGLKLTVPIFEEISWPTPPVFAQADTEHESEEASEPEAETESEAESETVEEGTGNYEDGVHIGQGVGYSGTVNVQVTVKNHQIVDIEVLNHNDTPSFFEKARGVINSALKAQTWEVDTISGATYSSRGILEAVRNALTGEVSTSAVGNQDTTPDGPMQVSSYKTGTLKDGSYTGSAKGFGGQIKVKVTIKGGRITDIIVMDHSSETASFYQRATAIISKIIKAQSPNVDTISGATYSSNGIREAVKAALRKASGTKKTDTKKPQKETEDKNPPQTESSPDIKDGIPQDGIFTGFATCAVYGYRVTVKATYQNGNLNDLSMETDNNKKSNNPFIERAWDGMRSAILTNQDGKVDGVSGATYTSDAIRKAYITCLNNAIGNPETEVESETETEKTTESETDIITEPETEPEDEAGEIEEKDYGITLEEDIQGDTVIYTGEVLVDTDSAGNSSSCGWFTSYKICVRAVFENDGMKSMEVLKYMIPEDVSDDEYYDDQYYTDSAISSLLPVMKQKGTASVDTISGATCSSKALIRFYQTAKQEYARYLKKHQTETEGKNTEAIPETESMTETEMKKETEQLTESETAQTTETEAVTEPITEHITELITESVIEIPTVETEKQTKEQAKEENEIQTATEKQTEIRTISDEEREAET